MKITFSLFLLSSALFCDTIDVSNIAKKVDLLKDSKKSSATLDYRVFDPFAKAKPLLAKKELKPVVKTARPIVIQTILNTKALINGRWYGIGAKVHGATIKAIKADHIAVLKNGTYRTITLKTKKSIIKTKERSR